MNITFLNDGEFSLFCTLLGNRRIREIKEVNSDYESEKKSILANSQIIFEKYNSPCNYLEEINVINIKLATAIGSEALELETKRAELQNSFKQFLSTIELSDREDLELFSIQIESRDSKVKEGLDIIEKVIALYPNATSINPEEVYLKIPLFKQIESLTLADYEEKPLEDTQTDDYKEVVRITKADETLVASENAPEDKELNHQNVEENTTTDYSFFNDDFSWETPFSISDLEIKEAKEEEIATIDEEKPTASDLVMPKKVEEETLTFTLEDGISLSTLAFELCGDSNGWYDIFDANKEKLLARLKEKNGSLNSESMNQSNIENDDRIFAGIDLIIPKVYKKKKLDIEKTI